MGSVNIEMRLNLVDTASAPVRAFISTLETLESAVSGVSSRLAGLAGSMDALGASLGLIKTNSAGAAAELGAVGMQAGTAAGETARLETIMAALSLSLERIVGQLAMTSTGLAGVGSAAVAASTEAGAAMNAVGTGAQGAGTHVNALAASIRGMGELWAAFKIEKGLKTAVEDAAEYERTDNRLRNMNLSPAESDAIHQSVRQTGRDFHQFDQNELLEMAIDLRNATGSAHEAATGLKGFAESVFAMNLSMPSGKKLDEQGTLNFAKFLEGRGVTMDPAAMAAQQDLVTKIVAATQGRVNPNNLFGNLTYAKGGLGRTMDDEALVTFAAMIEQDAIGGGTGGRVGTMLTSFVNSITKSRAITTKNRDEWLKLGLVDPGKVNINENTDRVTSIQAGAIAGTDIVGKNFKRWVDEYLRPALIAAGVNMDDVSAVKAKTDVLFPDRNSAEAAFQLLSKKDLIEKDSENITKTAGKDQQVKNGEQLSAANWERFHKAINDLAIAIGTTLLPVLTPLLQGFTKILEVLGHLTQDHPVFGFILGLAGALGSVSLMIAGVTRLFGPLGAILGVTAGSFGGFGTMVSSVGGIIASAIPLILRFLLRLAGPIGIILLIWDAGLGDWISKLEVFGHSVGDWASLLSEKVANSFRNMWVRTKEYFGFLSKDAADAQVEANNRASAQRQGKLGFGPQPVAKRGGASGDWDRGEEVSPAAKAVEDKIKRDKAIAKQLQDNKDDSADLLGAGRKKRGRFKNYDANLDDAKNDLRLEEDELARHMKAEDELYKAQKISIDEYYDDKLATMRKSINAQIAELERERAAYKRQGDKAGVNRADTEITLRKRDLSDNEKSVEVQREKDLNTLKERGLQLEAQQLQAEGKRNQAALAREVQRLKKDQEEYLRNGDYEHAMLAQKAIDTANLTAAWEKYGDAVKKVREDTQTKETAVDAEVRSGNLTKYQAEQKIFALRQQEARQLDELIVKERALIEASDAPQAVKDQRLKTLGLAQARTNATLSEMNPEDMRVKQTLDNSIEGGFANFFNSVISGSKSATNAFKDFADSIKSTLTKLISEQLGRSLFESLFGAGGTSGGGSLFGAGGFLGGLFSGKSSVNANADISMVNEGGGFFSGLGDFASNLFSFDVGTDRVPQDMIAQIHKGEMIVPAYDAERLRSLTPGGQGNAATAPILQIHPDAFHMKLGDWLEGEMARQLAHRR
ncbi:MAG: hypothetical protein ACXWIJ_12525 [Burkholderiales bacterium]